MFKIFPTYQLPTRQATPIICLAIMAIIMRTTFFSFFLPNFLTSLFNNCNSSYPSFTEHGPPNVCLSTSFQNCKSINAYIGIPIIYCDMIIVCHCFLSFCFTLRL